MFTPDRSSLQSKTKGKVTQQQPVLMALCKYNAGSYTFVKQENTACSLLPQVHSCVTKPQQPTLSRVTSKPCDLFPPPLILAATSYTQASKFQLSLKPTIYKLLPSTPHLFHPWTLILWQDLHSAAGGAQRAPSCKSAAVKCNSSCLREVYRLSAVIMGDGSLTYLPQGSIRGTPLQCCSSGCLSN